MKNCLLNCFENNRTFFIRSSASNKVFLFVVLSFIFSSLFGQSYTYYELSSKNQKQIASARKEIEKNLEQENTLLTQQKEKDITEKLITLYRQRIGSYRAIYETYSAHIYEFWTKFKGNPEEVSVAVDYTTQARDIYIAAQNEMIEADRVREGTKKLIILKEASEKFKQATELIEKAYEIYRSTPLESDATTRSKNLQRNDSLKQAIQKQSFARSPEVNSETIVQNSPTNLEITSSAIQQQDTPAIVNTYTTVPASSEVKIDATPTIQDKSKVKPNTSTTYAFTTASNAKYWVQIAACRVPLSNWQLNELVSDTLRVVEKFIDFWYKYRVGPFDYEQAKNFAIKCGIKGAFIVSDR
ncbi:MAG TPA: hypothetical protein PLD12_12305 [Bacteroidales bacterium]|mgnify:CR=1 FL=1|nr:hypothetical protein [Bacteroidales bacterium]HOK99910.1 hypothetical protein [Bacteroidales bacterium]HPO66035.1 hypothetical protein [Bacteroidales bacterium]